MPVCASIPATVDTDTSTRGIYLADLETCMKTFNEAITSTMNSYRNLLSAFDQVAQVYGNISQHCGDEARKPITEFRDGMRDLKDRGGFDTFNNEIYRGTVSVLDVVKTDLKKANKSYSVLRGKQKDYDVVRYKLDMLEKSYAKKNKPLSGSKNYQKTLVKRDKAKLAYETNRDNFGDEVNALQATTRSVLLESFNNYLYCTATFCSHLETTMSSYRTDVSVQGPNPLSTDMGALKEKAEEESSARRSRRINEAEHLYTKINSGRSYDNHSNERAGEFGVHANDGEQKENSFPHVGPNANNAAANHTDSANPFLGVKHED